MKQTCCSICKKPLHPQRAVQLESGEVICPRDDWEACSERSLNK